jgi:amino acid transporter
MSQSVNRQQTSLAVEQEKKLVKSLRRSDIVLFIVAAVIALDTIGTIASGGLENLFWGTFMVLTFMIPFSMIFAETGGAFPQEGGPYQWVKFAYGRLIAGVTSVLYWITNPIWLGGTLVLVAHEAFNAYVFDLSTNATLDWIFKLAFVWIAILLAIVSLKTGKIFVNIGAWAKLIVLMLLVGTTVVYGFKNGFQGLDLGGLSPSLGGFLAVAPVLAFAYVGFEAPNAASEEMFDPAKDTAPAIRRGATIAMLAYLLPVLAILLVIPADEVGGVDSFMGAVATVFSIYGSAGNTLLTITALLLVYALLNQGSSWMIATDRIQAMAAADGTFFSGYFGEFNEKLGTPLRVNILSGVMSTVFVVAATLLVEGDAAVLFSVVLFCAISTLLVSYLTIIPALMKLKRMYPDVPRSYQVPGGSRGFHILGSLVMAYIVIGSIVALFPGTLETALGIEYDYTEIWGTTQGAVLGFTLGTFVIVVLIGVIGYLGAGRVRKNLAD